MLVPLRFDQPMTDEPTGIRTTIGRRRPLKAPLPLNLRRTVPVFKQDMLFLLSNSDEVLETLA